MEKYYPDEHGPHGTYSRPHGICGTYRQGLQYFCNKIQAQCDSAHRTYYP